MGIEFSASEEDSESCDEYCNGGTAQGGGVGDRVKGKCGDIGEELETLVPRETILRVFAEESYGLVRALAVENASFFRFDGAVVSATLTSGDSVAWAHILGRTAGMSFCLLLNVVL